MDVIDLTKTDEILAKYPAEQSSLIPVLQAIQDEYGYVPEATMDRITERLNVPISKIYGVVTFYSQFYLHPHGKNVICTCQGTACHVKGSDKLLAEFEKELNIKEGETTEDLQFTLKSVACLGACALAPLMVINKTYYGNMSPEKVKKVLKPYRG